MFCPWVPSGLELVYDDTCVLSKQDAQVKLGFEKYITASITHHCIANKVVKVFTSEDSLKSNYHDDSDDGVAYRLN